MTHPLATRVRWALDRAATAKPAELRERVRELWAEVERPQNTQSPNADARRNAAER